MKNKTGNSSKPMHWHLVSGEFPPDKGGIGFYTKGIAEGLAADGQNVDVWCANYNTTATSSISCNYQTNPIMNQWDEENFVKLSNQMDRSNDPRRILLQFSPEIYGGNWNLDLARWVKSRRAEGDQIWVMVHKLTDIPKIFSGPRSWITTFKQKQMLKLISANADRVFIATSNWHNAIKTYMKVEKNEPLLLPVPSNVPLIINQQRVANLRKALAEDAPIVIGSFGSFIDPEILDKYNTIIPKLLENHSERIWLCLGRDSESYCSKLKKKYPKIAASIRTTGELDAAALSAHIQACDMMLQPYPQGVTTRRSSIMAGMLHARPIVTSLGSRTESIWKSSDALSMVPWTDTMGLTTQVEKLIEDPQERINRGNATAKFYLENFAVEKTIESLVRH